MPRSKGIEPRGETAEFPQEPATDRLTLLVSGDGNAPLTIHQDARIFAGRMTAGTDITHHIMGQAYVLVSDGSLTVDGKLAHKGDGIAISGTSEISLAANDNCEVLIIEVAGLQNAR